MWMIVKKIVINKYFITLLVFAIYLIFFADYNVKLRQQQEEEISRLEQEKEYYKKEIARNLELERQLNADSLMLEKVAREQYYMKKPNEDVFLVVQEDTTGNQK